MEIKYLIVHHTGGTEVDPLADSSNQSFDIVNEDHRRKWNFKSSLGYYIGYQYFIDKAGKITQGRKDNEEGAHTIGRNKESIGICIAGNFDLTMPTPEQIKTLKELLIQKKKEYNILPSNIIPHRHFAVKTCYGKNLSEDWARGLLYHEDTTHIPQLCGPERDTIEQQKKQILNLQSLIASLVSLFKKT